jgi:hypothetical protein
VSAARARVLPAAVLALSAALAPVAARADLSGACDAPPCSRVELQRYEHRVTKHLLRAQQARFEADARGEKKLAVRYDRVFKQQQARRSEVQRALESTR